MIDLILSTRNSHKVAEIRDILGGGFRYRTLADFEAAPQVVEDASTFAGNATKKAVELAKWLAMGHGGKMAPETLVLADDSGLEVDALNGAPGVHSARFAALDSKRPGNSSDEENCRKLLGLLSAVPLEKRTGRFRCVLALTPILGPTPQSASPVCEADAFELATRLFEGACEGHIGLSPRGQGGFGYDPLFFPNGRDQTFAELGESVKNELSHRAKALVAMKAALVS